MTNKGKRGHRFGTVGPARKLEGFPRAGGRIERHVGFWLFGQRYAGSRFALGVAAGWWRQGIVNGLGVRVLGFHRREHPNACHSASYCDH